MPRCAATALASLLLGGCAFVIPVTLSTSGQQSNGGEASGPAISFTGRVVAFNARATNLVPGDTNASRDVFVRDVATRVTKRVSVTSTGAQAHGDSAAPMLDRDGRMVVFVSSAPDLVPGDTNGVQDVFVHDRTTGVTRRVSVASNGAQANDASSTFARPAISGNGRFVAFATAASNLVPNDTNGVGDVVVYDLQTGVMELVSVSSSGTPANGGSVGEVSLSADGRFVAFDSGASNLVPGDTNGRIDAFVRDRDLNQTIRVSVASNGAQANGDTQHRGMWISGDGNTVTFQSSASNLVPNDTNGAFDVFVRDLLTNTTTRVNVASDGTQALGGDPTEYGNASLSYDGRYVSFDETATNLVPGDTNGAPDTFVHDRVTGRTERVSVASDGTQANSFNGNQMISGDGRYVLFGTVSSNLFPNDKNGTDFDIVMSAVLRPVIDSVTPASVARGTSATLTVHGAWFGDNMVAKVGDGIDVAVVSVRLADPTTLLVDISVSPTAATGFSTLFIANPGTGPSNNAGAGARCVACVAIE